MTGCVCRSARWPVTHSTTQTVHLIGQLGLVFRFSLFKLQYLLRSDCQKTRQNDDSRILRILEEAIFAEIHTRTKMLLKKSRDEIQLTVLDQTPIHC